MSETRSAPGTVMESRWRPSIIWFVLLVALVIAANANAIADLAVLWWTNDSYGHGLLVVPISLYLIWRSRDVLQYQVPTATYWGVPLLFLLSVLWFIGFSTDTVVLEQFVLVLLVGVLVLTVLGWHVSKILVFPLAYLVFAIPVWEVFVPVLRDNTAVMAHQIVQQTGVPIFSEGRMLQIANGAFEIADVCAGLRFLLAGLSVAALYAYLSLPSKVVGGVFLLITVTWVIVFNWIRVAIIILIGHFGGMDHPLVQDHNSVGWVLFAVAMIPLFLLGERLRNRFLVEQTAETSRSVPVAGVGARRSDLATVGIVAALVVSSGPLMAYWLDNTETRPPPRDLRTIKISGDWVETRLGANPLHSTFSGADQERVALFTKDGASVSFYVAYYADQDQGAELISDLNSVYDRAIWNTVSTNVVSAHLPETVTAVREVMLKSRTTGLSIVVWYWYDVAHHQTLSPVSAKLLQVWGVLRGKPGASVVSFSTSEGEDPGVARATLRSAANAVLPGLYRELRGSE